MPQGNPKARTHKVFTDRLDELKSNAAAAHASFRTGTPRPWWVPTGLATKDLQDVPHLHEPSFDRTAINTNYEEAMQTMKDIGTVGDVIGLKLQIGYVATEERAFRARHSTVCRAIAHMHSRLAGHGLGEGGVFPTVRKTVDDTIKAGGATQQQ